MFEKASRMKLRFVTSKGLISTEDLWDLPLDGKCSLNTTAIAVHKELKNSSEISFVSENTPEDTSNLLRMEILKHIIGVKQQESLAAKNAAVVRQQKQRILEIINQKQDAALGDLSLEELQKKLEEL